MTVRELDASRRDRPDLLARPLWGGSLDDEGWAARFTDTTDQLEALADLLARGLLSAEEFERQKAKVIDPWGSFAPGQRPRRAGP
jgi:hypothetical protein